MKVAEEANNSNSISGSHPLLFTNFEGKFAARLSAVIPIHVTNTTENAPISAKYDCRSLQRFLHPCLLQDCLPIWVLLIASSIWLVLFQEDKLTMVTCNL